MSTTGVHLNSEPQLTLFRPTIREYMRSLEDAVASDNLSAAQQALAQLRKAAPSPGQGQSSEPASRVSQGLQDVGNALEAGDLSGAKQAVAELHQSIQSVSEGQAQQDAAAQLNSSNGADPSSGAGDNSEMGPSLSVRV